MKKYYIVKVRGGHVGAGRHTEISFNFRAKNMADAIEKARRMPGVKHENNAAILSAKEITEQEYLENRKTSAYKNVLGWRSSQDD